MTVKKIKAKKPNSKMGRPKNKILPVQKQLLKRLLKFHAALKMQGFGNPYKILVKEMRIGDHATPRMWHVVGYVPLHRVERLDKFLKKYEF